MSRRHDLTIRLRKTKQVPEVCPTVRRSQLKSIALLGFYPLLQIRASVRIVQVLPALSQPIPNLREKCLSHSHYALDLAARDFPWARLKQICTVQPVFPQKLRHGHNRGDKNNQRC